MKAKTLILVILILVIICGTYYWTQQTFYTGKWGTEFITTNSGQSIQPKKFTISKHTIRETSDFIVENMQVKTTVVSKFAIENKEKDKIAGKFTSREIKKIEYTFVDPKCKDDYECQQRDQLKKNFEDSFKESVALKDEASSKITITKISNRTILLESVLGKEILTRE
jgi:hypothetical protein